MPVNNQSNASTIRAGKSSAQFYLGSFFPDSPVYVSTLTATPATDEVQNLTVSASPSTGTFNDINYNMHIEVYDGVSSNLKGTLRVASGGTISSTSVPVQEFTDAHVKCESGDTIKIHAYYPLAEKLVGNTADFLVDGRITFGTQTTALSPVANMGNHRIGFVDAGQTYWEITFDATTSFNVDLDSGSTKTYSWDFGSNASPTSSTSSTPTVQFNVGHHTCSLTVTDSSNSATATRYFYVRVYDRSSNEPVEVTDVSFNGQNYRNCSITLQDNATLTDFPDGTLVGVFMDSTINATLQAFGTDVSGTSHIACVGFLSSDRGRNNSDGTKTADFEVVSPQQKWREINVYGKLLEALANPEKWNQFGTDQLSLRTAIVYLLRYFTTYLESFDLITNFDDSTYPGFAIRGGTVYAAIDSLIKHSSWITCDRLGRMHILKNPNLEDLADRGSITTSYAHNNDDFETLEYSRSHNDRIRIVQSEGFDASQDSLFARYPGNTPLGGQADVTVTGFIGIANQTEMNRLGGHWGAIENRVYFDSAKVKHRLSDVILTVPTAHAFLYEPYLQWYTIDSEVTTARGIPLSTWRYYVESVNTTWRDNGTLATTVRLRPETRGLPAKTYTLPTGNVGNLPDYTPPYRLPAIGYPPYPDSQSPEEIIDWIEQNSSAAGANRGDYDRAGEDIEETFPNVGPTFANQGITDSLCLAVQSYVLNMFGFATQWTEYEAGQDPLTTGIDDYALALSDFDSGYYALGFLLPDKSIMTGIGASAMRTAMLDDTAMTNIACAMLGAITGQDNTAANFAASLGSYTPSGTNETNIHAVLDGTGNGGANDILENWLAFNSFHNMIIEGGIQSQCLCNSWCYYYSGGAFGSMWTDRTEDSRPFGIWNGSAWESEWGNVGGTNDERLYIQRKLPTSGNVSTVTFNFTTGSGGDGPNIRAVTCTLKLAGSPVSGGSKTVSNYTLNDTFDQVFEYANLECDEIELAMAADAASNSSVYDYYCNWVKAEGFGTNPEGSDNCP